MRCQVPLRRRDLRNTTAGAACSAGGYSPAVLEGLHAEALREFPRLLAVPAGHGCCPVPALLARTALRPDIAFVGLAGTGPATLALAWRRDGADERHHLLARVARHLQDPR